MSKVVPKRSTGGCLTCKRRKKKCDEGRPRCRRCEQGDFHCQGYGPSDVGYADATQASLVHWPLFLPQNGLHSSSSLESLDSLIPLSDSKDETRPPTQVHILLHEVNNCLSSVPNKIRLDPIVLEDATLLIVSQYLRFSRELLFKRPSSSMEQGLLWRMDDSEITRWSMYLSARVMKDVSSGNNGWKYMDWIFRFCQQILETPPTTRQEPSLGGRFGGLLDLVNLVFMVSGAAAGYSLFKRCAPEFLQLASLNPNLWYNDSTISIPEAIQTSRYEVTQFVIYDNIIALALGTPPLIHYNTTPSWIVGASSHYQIMYGFPLGILLLFAKVNAWRTSRLVGQAEQDRSDWRELEEHLYNWHPTLDHSDGPNNSIARLAVQEAWRQAAVIYLYMGMKEVNSADPRVEKAVQQIVQLGGTFETGHPFELHLMIPCLIAGVAARQEKHRSALRTKLVSAASRRVNMFILCGSDLITILDHLWHGAGSEGRPIMWDDYVQSRCTVLPAL